MSTFNRNLQRDCYIYFYHTDEFFIIPQMPDTINDNMESTFSSQNALSRTAPVFSYNNSGPRTVQVSLKLHRDLMQDLNRDSAFIQYNQGDKVEYNLPSGKDQEDYCDLLIRKLQEVALPRYDTTDKMVNPPMIAVRFADQVFIKGVVASGGVSITYDLPLLENNKYANLSITFVVSEVKPYDADTVGRLGSLRGLTSGARTHFQNIAEGKAKENKGKLDF